MTLHDLPVVERPRERLVNVGAQSLSGVELLALILGNGISGEPVMVTSQKLMGHFGSLGGVAAASLEDLTQIKGIGLAKAAQIQACVEVARRLSQQAKEVAPKLKLLQPEAVSRLVRSRLTTYKKEHYLLISLDSRNQLIDIDTLSLGTLDAALVHPRETFEAALRRHASKVILAHNHPSGDPAPSDDDIAVTRRLVTAGKIMGITVIDHIIVTEDRHVSLQAQGLI